jgi:hypothetical protein
LMRCTSQKWVFGEDGEEDVVSLEESLLRSSKPPHANAAMGHRIPRLRAFSRSRQIAIPATVAITRAVIPAIRNRAHAAVARHPLVAVVRPTANAIALLATMATSSLGTAAMQTHAHAVAEQQYLETVALRMVCTNVLDATMVSICRAENVTLALPAGLVKWCHVRARRTATPSALAHLGMQDLAAAARLALARSIKIKAVSALAMFAQTALTGTTAAVGQTRVVRMTNAPVLPRQQMRLLILLIAARTEL